MKIRVPINEQGDVAGQPAQRRQSAGDSIPPNCQVIEVHVAELNQLFNAIDPALYGAETRSASRRALIFVHESAQTVASFHRY
jgi:hypothetical protein